MWENLEVSARGRFWRRQLTKIVTTFLLLISFSYIYMAQWQQRVMKNWIPSKDLCSSIIPSIYYGSYTGISTNTTLLWNETLDESVCGMNEHYILFSTSLLKTPSDNVPDVVGDYQKNFFPCISAVIETECASLSCLLPNLRKMNIRVRCTIKLVCFTACVNQRSWTRLSTCLITPRKNRYSLEQQPVWSLSILR